MSSLKPSVVLLLHALFAAAEAADLAGAPSPAIDWASQPASANQTVLLLGGPFTASSQISLGATTTAATRTTAATSNNNDHHHNSSSGGSNHNAAAAMITVQSQQPSAGSVKFTIPGGLPLGQWHVTVDGSSPYILNGPQPWWVAGDSRQHATPGGHVRVFGSCVFVPSDAKRAADAELGAAKRALAAALAGDDSDDVLAHGADMDASVAMMALVRRVQAARVSCRAASAASASLLRLTARSKSAAAPAAAPVVLQSNAQNSTAWSAWFSLPATIAPGTYDVEIANHLDPENFVALGAFGSYISPDVPNATTITVLGATEEAARQPWKATNAAVFNVRDYGPSGLPGCGPGWSNVPCPTNPATGKPFAPQNFWANASVAIERACAAAAQAGGGTVYLPRGTYFVNSSWGFEVPWGVRLQGEGKDLVQIIFSETYGVSGPGKADSGAEALFRGPAAGTGGWAVSDLTVYVTAFHNAVFHVSPRAVGFEMQRVRAVANSFFGGNGPGKGRSAQANISWGLQDPGAMVVLLGSDFLLEDNDLYCDGTVITSTDSPFSGCAVQRGGTTSPGHCHGAAWGIIRNNRLHNGQASHFMPQWKQIIFEHNTILGISPIAGGQSLGTGPGGGRAQHVYHAHNSIRFVWGNDREIVTFDDAGSAYLGRVSGVSADGLTLTLASDARSSYSGEWKGWDGAAVTVLNGTGVGTWRRAVHSGIDATGSTGEFSNPHNRTWVIDRPFPFSLTAGQVISITPARSRIIFEGDRFSDGGTLQFYGQAQECVVDSLVGERMSGVVAWGQWRGWYLPKCGTMGMPPCPPPNTTEASSSHMLGGEMGNGIMMNTQLSYLNNRMLVGNKIVRWSAMGGGSYLPGFSKFYNGANFAIQDVKIEAESGSACEKEPGGMCHDWSQLVATSAVIFRANTAENNGGFQIGAGAFTTSIRDVVIEGNTVLLSDPDKAMQISSRMTDPVNGSCVVRGNFIPTTG